MGNWQEACCCMLLQINRIGINVSTQDYSHTNLQLINYKGNLRTFYFTLQNNNNFFTSGENYKQQLIWKLKTAQEIVINNLQKSQLKSKVYHTKNTKDHSFKLWDYAWVQKRCLSKTSVSMAWIFWNYWTNLVN